MNDTPKKNDSAFQIPDHLDLDLPSDPDFHSEPIVYSVAEMIKICEPMLPYWNKQKRENPVAEIEWEAFTL